MVFKIRCFACSFSNTLFFNNSDKFLRIYCVYCKVELRYFLFPFAKSYEFPVFVFEASVELENIMNWLLEKAERGICWLFNVYVVHKINVYPTGCIFQMYSICYVFRIYCCQDIFSSSVSVSFFAIFQPCARDQYVRAHVLHVRWYCNTCQPEPVRKIFGCIFIHKACVRRRVANVRFKAVDWVLLSQTWKGRIIADISNWLSISW